MITFRASTVDSFRLYSDPDLDFISAEEMDARILKGEEDGEDCSEAAGLGRAFHAAVAGDYTGATLFDAESVAWARAGLEGATPEVFGSVVLDVDGTPARLTGHADWLRGMDMWEIKTSGKPIPPGRYADAMQWRCYCTIFGIQRVTYRLVQLDEDAHGEVYAKAIDDVVLRPYPGLRDDVVQCVRSLLVYARTRGLVLPESEVAA